MSFGSTPPFVASTMPSLKAIKILERIRFLGQLRLQAHARPAAVIQLLAHRFEKWLRFLEDRLIAADHEGQGPAGGSRCRASAWSVEKIDTLGLECLTDLAAGARTDGARIGDHSPGTRPLNDSIGSQDYLSSHSRWYRRRGKGNPPSLPPGEVYRKIHPFSSAASLRALSAVFDHSATSCPARRRFRAIG